MTSENISLRINDVDITGFANTITWSGDLQQCSRTVGAKLSANCKTEVGDRAVLYFKNIPIFRGVVVFVDIKIETVSIECFDFGIYLNNNKLYKEYKGIPQDIAKQACAAIGIKVGNIAKEITKTKVTAAGGRAAFKVIEEAYEGKKQKAKQYSFSFDAYENLNIDVAGSQTVEIVLQHQIETPTRSMSIKDMVNKVDIITAKNKYTSFVESKADRQKFGTMTGVYKQEKNKNAQEWARDMIASVTHTGTLTALGDITCVSGKAVIVTEPKTGFSGMQIIKKDKHTWSGAEYIMSLEFYYEH